MLPCPELQLKRKPFSEPQKWTWFNLSLRFCMISYRMLSYLMHQCLTLNFPNPTLDHMPMVWLVPWKVLWITRWQTKWDKFIYAHLQLCKVILLSLPFFIPPMSIWYKNITLRVTINSKERKIVRIGNGLGVITWMTTMLVGVRKKRIQSIFPEKICKEYHLNHQCSKIKEARLLLAQRDSHQQPIVLTNHFPPQGQ